MTEEQKPSPAPREKPLPELDLEPAQKALKGEAFTGESDYIDKMAASLDLGQLRVIKFALQEFIASLKSEAQRCLDGLHNDLRNDEHLDRKHLFQLLSVSHGVLSNMEKFKEMYGVDA
jgi:hypothetical protein